jgi:hypothetical protein
MVDTNRKTNEIWDEFESRVSDRSIAAENKSHEPEGASNASDGETVHVTAGRFRRSGTWNHIMPQYPTAHAFFHWWREEVKRIGLEWLSGFEFGRI